MIISSRYDNQQMEIKSNNSMSRKVKIMQDVRQGCIFIINFIQLCVVKR